MVEATDAATLVPTADSPSEPSPSPAPDPALQPAVQDDPGREGSAASPDGGEPTGDEGGAPDPAAQLTALGEHVAEIKEAATKEGHDAALKRMDGHGRQQTVELRTIAQAMPAIAKGLTALEKRARDGEPAAIEEYDELLTKHGERIDTFTGFTYHAGGVAGWIGLLGGLDDTGELAKEFGPRLQAVGNQDFDPTLMADIKEHITKAAVKAALETDRPKTAKQTRSNYDAEIRQMARGDTKPPASPTGSAAGGAGQPRDETEARNLHAKGEWSTAELQTWMASH